MNPGKPKKSAKLKLLQGNQGRHKSTKELEKEAASEIVVEPLTEIPKPPIKLKGIVAKREWNRLMPILIKRGIISDDNLSSFVTYCNRLADIAKCDKNDQIPPASLIAQFRLLAEEFGLTPASRVKVKTISDNQEEEGIRGFIG